MCDESRAVAQGSSDQDSVSSNHCISEFFELLVFLIHKYPAADVAAAVAIQSLVANYRLKAMYQATMPNEGEDDDDDAGVEDDDDKDLNLPGPTPIGIDPIMDQYTPFDLDVTKEYPTGRELKRQMLFLRRLQYSSRLTTQFDMRHAKVLMSVFRPVLLSGKDEFAVHTAVELLYACCTRCLQRPRVPATKKSGIVFLASVFAAAKNPGRLPVTVNHNQHSDGCTGICKGCL